MKIEEYLLIKLMEEASEIVKACSKILIFTGDHAPSGRGTTNMEELKIECNDFMAVHQLLCNVHIGVGNTPIDINLDAGMIAAKKARLMHYAGISQQLGTLDAPDN